MQHWQKVSLSLLTMACLAAIAPRPAQANMFSQTEVDQSRYAVMAVPLARGGYRLLVVEQIKDTRPCWSESGSNPVVIDPLLTTFDFTGICGRATDSNGYSIRVAQQDLGLQYNLRIERGDGELLLVGSSNRGGPKMVIGRTHGLQEGQFLKFHLEPTWRLTRRTYEGQVLGHVYFTNDSWEAATGSAPSPLPAAATPVGTETNVISVPKPQS
ncbi:DUF3747 domain-containing protein [Thermosynechococcus sp.]|uniref:DUF3747 domain-containing protein n=1 Tax=Thermosynechococcus sp. TaxID=2814275 RepID=UPI00391CD499